MTESKSKAQSVKPVLVSLRSMAVLSSRAHEQRSCEIRDRHAFQVAPAPISSRFLCPRPPLLLSAPNQNRHATQASLTWFQAFTHGEKYTEEKNEGGEAALWYSAPLSTTVPEQSDCLHHLKSLCSMAPFCRSRFHCPLCA